MAICLCAILVIPIVTMVLFLTKTNMSTLANDGLTSIYNLNNGILSMLRVLRGMHK